MQQNFTQRIEMQIPQENVYSGSGIIVDKENRLMEFLKNHYNFPSDNLNEILDYIEEDSKLERIIYEMPKIISKEFQKSPVSIDFMKYASPDETTLQITIKSPFDGETSGDKEDIILEELFKYDSPDKHYFITMEF
ncbi:MAG: hypothetical protein IJ258_02030 [Methanobrevibacter sp.]|uniref:hypothetical protein n=1 Tax=Methanobrevibacter sp. TaxID=66852 RepID=UPI0025E94EE9|nr:hypothetical protein [Methanobrevibacter sp.]MBQ8016863.1 hypothetical protein [Methanobrevibacter sp.]